MIQIVYVVIQDLEPHYDALCRAASPDRLQRVQRFRREDALRCLAAGALLRYAAAAHNITEFTLAENPWGKPYLENQPDFHFNLTHSGQFAAVAWGRAELGIDLEPLQLRSSIHSLAQRYFTVPEQKYLFSGDSQRRFYEIWTAKESYLKYLGTGLTKPLTSFCTRSPALQAMLTSFFPEDRFCLTVCAEVPCAAPVRLEAEQLL